MTTGVILRHYSIVYYPSNPGLLQDTRVSTRHLIKHLGVCYVSLSLLIR